MSETSAQAALRFQKYYSTSGGSLSTHLCHIGDRSAFGHLPVPDIILAHIGGLVKLTVPFLEQTAFYLLSVSEYYYSTVISISQAKCPGNGTNAKKLPKMKFYIDISREKWYN